MPSVAALDRKHLPAWAYVRSSTKLARPLDGGCANGPSLVCCCTSVAGFMDGRAGRRSTAEGERWLAASPATEATTDGAAEGALCTIAPLKTWTGSRAPRGGLFRQAASARLLQPKPALPSRPPCLALLPPDHISCSRTHRPRQSRATAAFSPPCSARLDIAIHRVLPDTLGPSRLPWPRNSCTPVQSPGNNSSPLPPCPTAAAARRRRARRSRPSPRRQPRRQSSSSRGDRRQRDDHRSPRPPPLPFQCPAHRRRRHR
jgi:hypothetical protein